MIYYIDTRVVLLMQNLIIINKIQNGEISLANVKNNQEKFQSYLKEIKKRKQKL